MTPWLVSKVREQLLDAHSPAKNVALHDWLTYAVCRAHGKRWVIDDKSSVKYRQHGNNVVGANVGFPNKDKVRHHVYSFSAGNKFELKLFGRDESRSVVFHAVGVAAIGCNIHDQMVGFIRVVDTPWAIKTGPDGVATLRGIPAGAVTVTIWHPYMRAPKNELVRKSMIAATGVLRDAVIVDLRMPAMPGMDH